MADSSISSVIISATTSSIVAGAIAYYVKGEVSGVGSRVSILESDFAELTKELSELRERIDDLENHVSSMSKLEDESIELRAEIEALKRVLVKQNIGVEDKKITRSSRSRTATSSSKPRTKGILRKRREEVKILDTSSDSDDPDTIIKMVRNEASRSKK